MGNNTMSDTVLPAQPAGKEQFVICAPRVVILV